MSTLPPGERAGHPGPGSPEQAAADEMHTTTGDVRPLWTGLAAVLDAAGPADDVLDARTFAVGSPRLPALAEVATYARPSFPPGRPLAVGDLCSRIHADFSYVSEPG